MSMWLRLHYMRRGLHSQTLAEWRGLRIKGASTELSSHKDTLLLTNHRYERCL